MFSYRAVLKKAFEVVLNHKYLWFFGFFATFLASGAHFNIVFGKMDMALMKEMIMFNMLKNMGSAFPKTYILSDLGQAFKYSPLAAFSAIVFILGLLVLFSFFVWTVVVSEAAIINNSAQAIKKNKRLTIKDGINAGIKNFWPVLGINLVGKLFICFLLVFISLPIIFIQYRSGPAFDLLYILLFLVFLPIALIIGFLVKYASAYVVIGKKKFIESFEKAWALFLKNWLASIESAFLILFINWLVCLLAFLLVLVLAIPAFFIYVVVGSLLGLVIAPALVKVIFISMGMILGVLIVAVIGSALTAFRTTAWTNIFLELDSKKPTLSKLMRIFG